MSSSSLSLTCSMKGTHTNSGKHSYTSESIHPDVPRKIICDSAMIDVFRHSSSYRKIMLYIQACSEAVKSTPFSQRTPSSISQCCPTVRFFVEKFFPFLHHLVDEIPLEDMSHQRFGNRAKRVFHVKLEEQLESYMRMLVDTFPLPLDTAMATATANTQKEGELESGTEMDAQDESSTRSKMGSPSDRTLSLVRELSEYIKDSFGNATRLDYGSGHELHFFIVILLCLELLGDTGETLEEDMAAVVRGPAKAATARTSAMTTALSSPPTLLSSARQCALDPSLRGASQEQEDDAKTCPAVQVVTPEQRRVALRLLRRQFVFYVFDDYIRFVRRLQQHYSLEPAGSHGVWGLDDYHHIPYIFGAAQLIGCEESGEDLGTNVQVCRTVVSTADVCDKAKSAALKDEYMYFAMVSWIYEHKTGPFFEHSNMLYNISGVPKWLKIYGGMIKMFSGEVLTKFNVCQHLLFGKHLPWSTNVTR